MHSTHGLPETMRAAQGKDYGDIDEMISVEDGVKVPRLADLPKAKQKNFMLIKTIAVSLAPGDCRVLSGLTKEFQGPPSFPYTPGGDCCGIVVELPKDSKGLPFKVGDRVAVRFVEGPRGALSEYSLVSTKVADRVPESLSSDGAAALASASPATLLADQIKAGERVLVLGAGGGMGSHFCQLLRERGASYVCGVSCSPERLLKAPISCDKAIDYTKEDVFSVEEFRKDPFDVVVDFASGGWLQLIQSVKKKESLIVKSASQGGRYITTTPDTPTYEVHSIWQALKSFDFPATWRRILSRTWYRSKLPAFHFAMLILNSERGSMTRTMELSRRGKLQPVMDPKGPFPFTTVGTRFAFHIQENRHPQGKVVIHVADDE